MDQYVEEKRALEKNRRLLVVEQICELDDNLRKKLFPNRKEIPNYAVWREYLLSRKANNFQIEYEGKADRRWAYLYNRSRILKRKKEIYDERMASLSVGPSVPESNTQQDKAEPSATQKESPRASTTPPSPTPPSTSLPSPSPPSSTSSSTPSTSTSQHSKEAPSKPPAAAPEPEKEPKESKESKEPPPAPVQIVILKDEVSETYAFAGVHHIFVEHQQPVTRIEFAHNDKNLLAFSSSDGNISICNTLHSPRLIRSLRGHSEAVTDFAWSMTNDMIISTSHDKSVRVWLVRNGECVRVIQDKAVFTCCRFHPLNNNLFFVGTSKGVIQVMNLSTGKAIKAYKLNATLSFTSPLVAANSLELNSEGTLLFVGDSKGTVHTFQVHPQTGVFELIGKMSVSLKPISCLEYKGWISNQQHPALLVNCLDNSIKVFKVLPKPTAESQLEIVRQLKIHNSSQLIRASFCPLLTNRDSVCIVSGSEDSVVHIFDVKKEQPVVNKLQGHAATVYDVCWNYDETLLASCDGSGTVILWKRVLQVTEDDE